MGIIRLLFQFLVGWLTNRGQQTGYFRASQDSFQISLFFCVFQARRRCSEPALDCFKANQSVIIFSFVKKLCCNKSRSSTKKEINLKKIISFFFDFSCIFRKFNVCNFSAVFLNFLEAPSSCRRTICLFASSRLCASPSGTAFASACPCSWSTRTG